MGKMSNTSGKAGEREICRILTDQLGVKVYRALNQPREGGYDLDGLAGWCVETKWRATPEIPRWWRQTVDQAEANGGIPALLYRIKGKRDWRAVVALCDISEYWTEPRDYTYTADMPLEAWVIMVRETMEVVA